MKSQIAAAFWPALSGAGVLFMLYILFVPNPEGQARAKALYECIGRFTQADKVAVDGPIFQKCRELSLHPEQMAAAMAAKDAADAAAVACIRDSGAARESDFRLAAYKAAMCEEQVRRLYPGTRGLY